MNVESKFLDGDGIKTHYYEAGVGEKVVILVHGGGLDNAFLSWEFLMGELSGEMRVIAPDMPGYGKSDKPDVVFDMPFYLDFFQRFLDTLNVGKVDLVGISMGGAIVLGTALSTPEKINKLVLVDSYGLQRDVPFNKLGYLFVRIPGMRALTYWSIKNRFMVKQSLKMILKRPGTITDELVEQVYQQFLIPGVTKAFSDMQNADVGWNGLKTNFLDRIPDLPVKTLIIHGEKDTLVPVKASQEAHNLIQKSEMVILEGCGHWPQRDNPEEFNRVVRQFLLKD